MKRIVLLLCLTVILSLLLFEASIANSVSSNTTSNSEIKTPENLKDDAIDYNNAIIDQQTKIIKGIINLGNSFESKDGELMEDRYNDVLSLIQTGISEVSKLGPFDGSTKFKEAALIQFSFYQSALKNEFREIINILKKEDISDNDVKRIQELATKVTEDEKQHDKAFKKAQLKFTKKYNIQLQENELNKK